MTAWMSSSCQLHPHRKIQHRQAPSAAQAAEKQRPGGARDPDGQRTVCIIDGYTREAGVRNLERTITSVLRKCARKIASGEAENVSVTGTSLEKLLGPRMVKPEFLNRTNAIGIANGLAWTSIGGETLPIEVQVIDNGSGKITVTGSLGDVMKESAQLAITYARVHAAEYGIDSERLKKCDLHIHAPEGAVPKDGPSAGVTLTTALISCLSGIRCGAMWP